MPKQHETLRNQGQALAAALRGEADPPTGPSAARPDRPSQGDEDLPGHVSGVVEQIRQAFPGATVNIKAGETVSGGVAPAGDDRVSQLERLVRLRDSGVLTPEEFAQEKARILERE
ncbi:SHOCT domain-containing protein [Phytoactinopolyspora halotolerans]|uniref:SHOCT domain-containing protein n=2 Tax=Phytoactinopolyspora halotolerans TaxID=1981512 RepID=A0A6L9SC87_9ACTN|nr:SHOCT domain-containing protein [Phytoactinopolyspora halotolerans]